MKLEVCSVIHEAYAREKGEFLVREVRTVSHLVTNFIPESWKRRTFPKEV